MIGVKFKNTGHVTMNTHITEYIHTFVMRLLVDNNIGAVQTSHIADTAGG